MTIVHFFLVFQFSVAYVTSGSHSKYVDPFLFSGITKYLYDESHHRVSKPCRRSLADIQNHLKLGSSWAYQFLDASSKSTPGLIGGTVTSLGDYDQCLGTKSEDVDPSFQGKHCMIELQPPLYSNETRLHPVHRLHPVPRLHPVHRLHPVLGFFNPAFAVCVPSSCSEDDLIIILSESKLFQFPSVEVF